MSAIRQDISRGLCFLLGFLLPLPIKFGELNIYSYDLIITIILLLNLQDIVNHIKSKKTFKQLWISSFFVFALVALYGFPSASPFSHAKAAVQYLFCIGVALPTFFFICSVNVKILIRGASFGVVVALYLILSFLYFDATFFDYIFAYNVTGGEFRRVGLTAVNDYAILLYVIALLFIFFENRIFRKLFFVIVLFYLVVATGSRVTMVSFIVTVFAFIYKKGLNISFRTILVVAGIGGLISLYNVLPGLQRLVFYGLGDSDRIYQIKEAFVHLNSEVLGVGLLQYINPVNGYPVHNLFILMLVELGLVMGSFINLYFVFLFYSFCCKNSMEHKIPVFMMILILATITHAYDRFIWFIPAIVMATSYASNLKSKSVSSEQIKKPYFQRLLD